MEDYVVIGKITDTFGLEGELKVYPYLPQEFWESLDKVYLKRKGGDYIPFELEWIDFMKNFVILKFKGYDSIDKVEQFKGAKIYLPRKELPTLSEDEFYAFELVGMDVVTDKGKELGKVEGIRELGAYDALVLKNGELLIPFVSDIVVNVDKEKGQILVKEDLIPV
ncbi:ribosome maturation factor RimM [Aquifex sp.]